MVMATEAQTLASTSRRCCIIWAVRVIRGNMWNAADLGEHVGAQFPMQLGWRAPEESSSEDTGWTLREQEGGCPRPVDESESSANENDGTDEINS
jgi:hypothetical protein